MLFFILNPLKKMQFQRKQDKFLLLLHSDPCSTTGAEKHTPLQMQYLVRQSTQVTDGVGGVQYHVLCITLHPTFLLRAIGLIWTTDLMNLTWPNSPLPHSLLAHSAIETCSSRVYECVDIPYVPLARHEYTPAVFLLIVIWLCIYI